MSVKYVILARNLPEALACFSHPSFIITHRVLSFLPVHILQISPCVSILTTSVLRPGSPSLPTNWSPPGEHFFLVHTTLLFKKKKIFDHVLLCLTLL